MISIECVVPVCMVSFITSVASDQEFSKAAHSHSGTSGLTLLQKLNTVVKLEQLVLMIVAVHVGYHHASRSVHSDTHSMHFVAKRLDFRV
jgi:uncharacterized membrane protein